MTGPELKEILRLHALWAEGSPIGKKADLRGVDFRDAGLRDVNLREVGLQYADLRCADLRYADLRCADLQDADLQGAKLQEANLKGAKTSYKNNWARTFFLHGACKEACQWVEEQNLESLRELVARCPKAVWVEWLEKRGFWLGE